MDLGKHVIKQTTLPLTTPYSHSRPFYDLFLQHPSPPPSPPRSATLSCFKPIDSICLLADVIRRADDVFVQINLYVSTFTVHSECSESFYLNATQTVTLIVLCLSSTSVCTEPFNFQTDRPPHSLYCS